MRGGRSGKPKTRVPITGTRATLYDGVGVVKRHIECAGRDGLAFVFTPRDSFRISTKARFVNRGWKLVPPTIYSIWLLPIRIRSSDPLIPQGSKALNQPSDEPSSIRVAPELPCMRTSRA